MSLLDDIEVLEGNATLEVAWDTVCKGLIRPQLEKCKETLICNLPAKCIELPCEDYHDGYFLKDKLTPLCAELKMEMFYYDCRKATYSSVREFVDNLEKNTLIYERVLTNSSYNELESDSVGGAQLSQSQHIPFGVVVIENISEIPESIEYYQQIINLIVHNWKNSFDWSKHYYIILSSCEQKGDFQRVWQASDGIGLINLIEYAKKNSYNKQ